jgi:hypothetical protein
MEAGPLVAVTLIVIFVVAVALYFGQSLRNSESHIKPASPQFTNDDINRAALKLVHPRVPYVFKSYLGGTIAEADRAAAQIAALRKEFTSFEPAYMRREILGWLDFFDKRLAETRRDIETGESKKRVERHSAEMEGESDRADAVLASLNLRAK